MARIGFISVGHIDYVNDLSRKTAGRAVESLKKKGIDVVYFGEDAVTTRKARQLAKRIIKEEEDRARGRTNRYLYLNKQDVKNKPG